MHLKMSSGKWRSICLGLNVLSAVKKGNHYTDAMMGAIASQITSLTIGYLTVYSDADQRKHQSSASLAFVWGIHRGPVNSPHKWPVTRKMSPFDDVIMSSGKWWPFYLGLNMLRAVKKGDIVDRYSISVSEIDNNKASHFWCVFDMNRSICGKSYCYLYERDKILPISWNSVVCILILSWKFWRYTFKFPVKWAGVASVAPIVPQLDTLSAYLQGCELTDMLNTWTRVRPGTNNNQWDQILDVIIFLLDMVAEINYRYMRVKNEVLTHWCRVTHICVGNLVIIGSDNGLSPGRRQAIIRTNAGILLIEPLGKKLQWNFNRNSNIFIQENAFESVVCEMAAILSRPQCVKSLHMMVYIWFYEV